ncbi:MAG: methylenetetrahydrofolate--tRNA-(uracil(54)-C(5))-methyltransferase (FADH(2)-oxidizing) TrmFO [Clostridia bacterium]|nr:methylenetetrahydrofolate--tRNA-(uracil(54)-C(5))-methyltransferase (FADH(2)-oxidizing) TrmFO [Clostridia bacterium]
MTVSVIGAGLAGCECAYQLAKRGIKVNLYEMKPKMKTPAHSSNNFAELVCSNSLRSNELTNGVGLLKEEMRQLDGLIIKCADATKVPAGGALAVDREGFSELVTKVIKENENINIIEEEVTEIPEGYVIIASGPLTSDKLSKSISKITGDGLYFFDAAAPIVTKESIDFDKAFYKARYDKGTADYINCPMSREEYEVFYNELINGQEAKLHDFDKELKVFEGCMPVEVMAKRGHDTLLFGPLKPVGLENPKTGKEEYAVVQLRRDNKDDTLYNIVGFQTHLTFPEQKRIFSLIPGLENAEFVRYGVMHRNTYLNSPVFLDKFYRLKKDDRIMFAGQMTGVEGYIESAASGFCCGVNMAKIVKGEEPIDFTKETALGALSHYISDESVKKFQPMNINFGIIEGLGYKVRDKKQRYLKISERALNKIEELKERIL